MTRRKHSKVDLLPPEIVAEVHRLLATPGITYERVVQHLGELGHSISKSSIGRYGKDFLTRLQDLKVVKEQAKAILEETGGTGLEMEEAAAQIALQRVMEFLLEAKAADMQGEEVNKMISALARLQASSATRERVKDLKKKVEQAVKKVEEIVAGEKLDPAAALQKIKEEFYGLTK